MRILIVEDHPGICFALEIFLELEGYSSKSVDRGEIALEQIKQEQFDLILLDLNTNGMSAQDFMTSLSHHYCERGRSRPIVGLLSGSAYIDAEAKKLGADFMVRKPFEHEELLRKIAAYKGKLEIGEAV